MLMIVGERKPLDEIMEMLAPYKRVLVLGCGGCVTVCLSGGEKQAEETASQIRLASRAKSVEHAVEVDSITRQCDREFAENLKKGFGEYDAVLSLACGVGVNFMTGLFPQSIVLPGLNTTFYGANTAPGEWKEFCHGCGDCVLAWTGGICPIARCSKSLINGACGGTNKGKCEVKKEMDCGWLLIHQRMEGLGRLEELRKLRPPRDWRKDRGDGVRRMSHQEMATEEESPK
jgi:ferredoxin